MVKIKGILKSPKAVLCLICFVLIFSLLSTSVIIGAKSSNFSTEPAHIVLNKWTDKFDRKRSICFINIDDSATYHTTLLHIPSSQTKLIIKTENLRFLLYTGGKIIFDNTKEKLSGYGKQTHIIDISDLKENSEIFLYLSPIKKADSRISSDILLTSENDFLLDLLIKSAKAFFFAFPMLLLSVHSLIFGIIRLLKKEKSAPKLLYFSCCAADLFLIIMMKSSLSQLLIYNSVLRGILLFASCISLAVFFFAFFASIIGKNHQSSGSDPDD